MKEADVSDQYYPGRNENSNQDYLGLVINKNDNIYTVRQRNYFKLGDDVEIITPNMDIIKVSIKELYNDKLESIEVANQADSILNIKFDIDVPLFSMIRVPYL